MGVSFFYCAFMIQCLFDVPYKLFRKYLPISIYHALRKTRLGRAQQWQNFQTYRDIVAFYQEYLGKNSFQDKVFLELGSGVQPLTALHMLHLGAKHVICVEPKLANVSMESLQPIFAEELRQNTQISVTWDDFVARTTFVSDLALVPKSLNNSVDFFVSHLVLEHVNSLHQIWEGLLPLHSQNGSHLHRIDPSDHTYHALAGKAWIQYWAKGADLRHLQYSNRCFRLLNDPKCWMNRNLLPDYIQAAQEHGFSTQIMRSYSFSKVPIHKDLLKKHPQAKPEELFLTDFVLIHTRSLF